MAKTMLGAGPRPVALSVVSSFLPSAVVGLGLRFLKYCWDTASTTTFLPSLRGSQASLVLLSTFHPPKLSQDVLRVGLFAVASSSSCTPIQGAARSCACC